MRATFRFLLLAIFAPVLVLSTAWAEPSAVDKEKDSKNAVLLNEARSLINDKKLEEAVVKCDQIISSYKEIYKASQQKIYCAESATETLAYMTKAVETDKVSAIAIAPYWAAAYFTKGFALQDLQRIPEAKEALEHAVELSPFNSKYLSELGTIYQIEKNWTKAKELFKEAENNAGISSEESKARELGRARRSYAFCLTEEGKLDEAEAIYRECLKTDPHDAKAKRELRYIQMVRDKRK